MSVKKVLKSAVGIKFNYETDNENDRVYIPVDSYFYEKSSNQVWYKDLNGKYFSIWSNNDETSSEILIINSGAKQTIVNFDGTVPDDQVTITIKDEYVLSNSSITATITIGSDRDADELEWVDFKFSVINVVPKVSYDVVVEDLTSQAEGLYILNTIRI